MVVVRRDLSQKETVQSSALHEYICRLLPTIQSDLFDRAKNFRDSNTHRVDEYSVFKEQIDDPGGFFYVHWCGGRACEDRLQQETKATIRCIPLDNTREEGKCLLCGNDSSERVVIAKAY